MTRSRSRLLRAGELTAVRVQDPARETMRNLIRSLPAAVETISGVEVRSIHVDKGYRGHEYPDRFRVRISGQSAG